MGLKITKQLSFSQLSLFEQCPAKYYDRYVLGNKQPSSPPTFFGSCMHDTIEKGYTENKLDYQYLSDTFEDIMENKGRKDKHKHLEASSKLFYQGEGYKQLANFCDMLKTHKFLRCDILGIELVKIHKFKNIKNTFIGIMDLLVCDGDRTILVDWKTGKESSSSIKQLIIYAWLLKKVEGIEVTHIFPAYLKTPEICKLISLKELGKGVINGYLGWVLKQVTTLVNTKVSIENFKPKKNQYCKYCHMKKTNCTIYTKE